MYKFVMGVLQPQKLRDNEVLLVIQSAYELNPTKLVSRIGKIGFKVRVGDTLRGTKPRRP